MTAQPESNPTNTEIIVHFLRYVTFKSFQPSLSRNLSSSLDGFESTHLDIQWSQTLGYFMLNSYSFSSVIINNIYLFCDPYLLPLKLPLHLTLIAITVNI